LSDLSGQAQHPSSGDSAETSAAPGVPGKRTLGGAPVPHLAKMEAGFGTSLDGVTAHTGAEGKAVAAAHGAEAVAMDQQIFFAADDPPERVVAHEVAHTIQQDHGGAGARTFGGPLSDPLEQEAESAAAVVVSGGRAHVTGVAGPGRPQPFLATQFIESLVDEGKKALFRKISDETGYDPGAGTFDGHMDMTKAFSYVGVLTDKLSKVVRLRGSNSVHLHIDFNARSVAITGAALHLAAITADEGGSNGFACAGVDLAQFALSAIVDTGADGYVKAASFDVAGALVKAASFSELKAGMATPNRLTAAEIDLAGFHAAAFNWSGGNGWLANVRFTGGFVRGLAYPGLPLTNVGIANSYFTLDGIHSALAGPDDGSAALAPVPDVLPKDSHLEVLIDRGQAKTDLVEKDAAGGFDHFIARVIGADGKELALVQIDGFHGASKGKDAAGGIDSVHFKGDPRFVKALLASPPVAPRVADAVTVLEAAGITPDLGVDVTLTDVGVAHAGSSTTAKASLDATLDLGAVGSLHVTLSSFAAVIESASAGASFDQFTATLTQKGGEVAHVELNNASGGVALDASGQPAAGTGGTQFLARGNLPALAATFKKQLAKLPAPVQKIVPAVTALGVKGEVSGTVEGAGDDGGHATVGANLDLTLSSAGDNKVTVSLAGFHADKSGGVAAASFDSFEATLLTKGKPAASIFAAGVHGWKGDGDAKSMTIPKLVVSGNGSNLGALASSLSKNSTSLAPGIKDVCNLVAANAVAATGTVSLTDAKASMDASGKEHVDAKHLAATIAVSGVGTIAVNVSNFAMRDNGKGAKTASFDRLEARLKTSTNAEAAFFSAEGDRASAAGDDLHFTAHKVDARGDAIALQQLMDGASRNLKNLPEDVQTAFAQVAEFKVNGKGELELDDLDLRKTAKGTVARSDLHSVFLVPGVGKATIDIKGFVGDVEKTSTEVAFESLTARLSGLSGVELALFNVAVQSPGDASTGTPKVSDPHHAHVGFVGDQENRDALFAAIAKNLTALPPQVQTAIELLRQGASASANLNDVDLKSAGGKVTGRAEMSVGVDVPDVGYVDLKLKGATAAGGADTESQAAFQSLALELRTAGAPSGDPAASMEVKGGTVAKSGAFHVDSFEVKGNGALVAGLLTERSRALFPPEISHWLEMLDQSQLTRGAAKNINVTQAPGGGMSTTADELDVDGSVNLHDDAGHTYIVPDAWLVLKTAKVQLGAGRKPESVEAASLDAGGDFSYQSATGTIAGRASLHTDKLSAQLGSGPIKATAKGVKASGEITKNTQHDPSAHDGTAGQTAASADPVDKGAVVAGAQLIKDCTISTATPVRAGTYGTTFKHINIRPGTMLNVDLRIVNGAIASARVWFSPRPDFDGIADFEGAHIQVEGGVGVLRADTGNWFTEWLTNLFVPMFAKDYVGDAKHMPLDLSKLVDTVMTKIAALPPKHSDGPSIADVVNGIDKAGTGGHVDLTLVASQDRKIAGVTVEQGSDIYIHGAAGLGGASAVKLSATATKVAARVSGNEIAAGGVSTGNIDASKAGDHVRFTDFAIATLNLNGGVKPAVDASAPTPARKP
jgi:hypothetical protein